MAMNPDEYLRKLEEEADGIDPEAYLAELEGNQRFVPDISGPESAAAGFAQGIGQGFVDEAVGGFKSVRDATVGDYKFSDIPERYTHNRDKARKYFNEADQANPKSYGLGNMGGGFASAFVPGLGFSKLGRLGSAAAQGALAGYGESEKDTILGNLEDAAKTGAGSAAFTYALGKALPKTPKEAEEKIRKYANERAVVSSGAMTKEMRQLEDKGFMQKQGDFLLRKKIVTPLASLEQIAERAGKIKKKAGNVIGSTVDTIDGLREEAIRLVREGVNKNGRRTREDLAKYLALKKMINQEFGYNYSNVADAIENIILRDRPTVVAAPHLAHLQSIADGFRRNSDEGYNTLRSGLKNKTNTRQLIKSYEGLGNKYKQEVYDIISDELDRSVGNFEKLSAGIQKMYGQEMGPKISQEMGENAARVIPAARGADDAARALPRGPGTDLEIPGARGPEPDVDLPSIRQGRPEPSQAPGADLDLSGVERQVGSKLGEFNQANRDYAASAVAEATAKRRLGTVRTNRQFGLTTAIAAASGANLAGPVGGFVMGGINNFFRKYGSTLQATGGYKIANMLKENPGAFGQYSSALSEALRRGPRQFLMTNYLISKKDPQFMTFLDKLLQGQGP